MVVAVRLRHGGEGLAAVGGLPRLEVEHPDGIGVLRIGVDVHVVPGAAAQVRVRVEPLPALAPVIGAVEAASVGAVLIVGLNDGVYAAGARGRGGDADLAERAIGQPFGAGDLRPGVAAVAGLPKAGIGAAAHERVGVALHLPDAGVENVRVVRVEGEVGGAGTLALVEHLLPARAAIARAEDAALGVGPPGVAEGGDVGDIRILGMDDDVANVACVGKAGVAPGSPAIAGLIDAIAVRDVAADGGLAGAGVDDIGIGVGDGEGAEGGGGEVAVGDILPEGAAAGSLPDAAGTTAKVEGALVCGMSGDGNDAATAMRTDAAPFERAEEPTIHYANLQVTVIWCEATAHVTRRCVQGAFCRDFRAASNICDERLTCMPIAAQLHIMTNN